MYPLAAAAGTLYSAAEALLAEACVVQTVPEVNGFAVAVPGAWIVCSAAPLKRISPGARLAQLGASNSVPEPPAVCGQKLVIAVTPPCFLETYKQMTKVRIKASLEAAAQVPGWQDKLDVGIAAYFRWMAEHPEVAVTTVVEVHCAGRSALEARGKALVGWMRTVEGLAVLAREAGADIELDETAAAAIILTAEAYVHEYARRGRLDRVVEKAPGVQALARSLFERGGASDE